MPDDELPGGTAEPIAVVGMSGRFAGALDVPSFWRMLLAGTDAISEVPRQRYDVEAVFDPTPRTPGRTVSRWGGFIGGVDLFDAEFFGISPREAEKMDPQQRLVLEVAYEALEDAGLTEQVAGSDAGTFVGQLGGDYWHLQYRTPSALDFYAMTGSASRAMMSGRLSYAFDLRGPSVTLDTACSSSLVAVHHAVQSLRLGECGAALAAGVNVVLLPEEGIVYSGAGMLAKDGRCKFGSAAADGFVRSDGIGVVVLKRLSDARADGDRVRAVLLGSATGNDGQSSGYLVTPAVEGQRDVLLRAYRDAGIDPADVDLVEAHGTGTGVGDPVELRAIGSVLGAGRPADRPALIGSVKTNIGHAEAAAGVASLIKTVLCLENGVVPPSIHFEEPNPAIPWDDLAVRMVREPTPLPDRGRPAIAGISSFGISGTNAHLVLAAVPPVPPEEPQPDRAELLTLSAGSPEALADLAGSYADLLEGTPPPWRDVAYTAATRRRHMDNRLAVVADSAAEAAEALRDFRAGNPAPDLSVREWIDPAAPPRVAFLFPGQGSQWLGMGRELLGSEPVFRSALEQCHEAIRTERGWSLIDLLTDGTADRLGELDVVQPALWAMEVALAELWQSWGVRPDVVIGHSMGESAAAYVAGALSLEDACAVICRRSALAKRITGRGAMAFVELSAEAAAEAIAGREDSIALAAANSPNSTLLSGDAVVLGEVVAELEARDVLARFVKVDFASHSPQVDELRPDLLRALDGLSPKAGAIPIHSTLLGAEIDGSQLDAAYWARNIREPVDFVGAVRAQLDAGDTVFVELSPHPLLVGAVRDTGADRGLDVVAVSSLRREQPERRTLLSGAGALHAAGADVDLAVLTGPGRVVPLPGYPWQHRSYWVRTDGADQAPAPVVGEVGTTHPLLGAEVPAADAGVRVWEGRLDLTANQYLVDHRVQGTVILPGTAYIELATAAGRAVLGDVPVVVGEVHYEHGLFLDEDEPVTVRVVVRTGDRQLAVEVSSRDENDPDGDWQPHVRATVAVLSEPPRPGEPLADVQARCSDYETGAEFYPRHAANGNEWAGTFQAIEEVWRRDGEALTRLRSPESLLPTLSGHHFHPALLDAAGHSLVAARPEIEAGEDAVFVLGSVGEARMYRRPGPDLWSHARIAPADRTDSFTGDITVYDGAGEVVSELRDLRLQYLAGRAPRTAEPRPLPTGPQAEPAETLNPSVAVPDEAPDSSGAGPDEDWLHEVRWVPTGPVHPGAGTGTWVVLSDSGTVGRGVVRDLRDRGHQVTVVTAAAGPGMTGSDRYRVDPASREQLAELLADLAARGPLRGVVHLWSLDAVPGPDATSAEVDRAETLSCHSVLHLAQVLGGHPAPLWLVTQGAQPAAGEPVTAPFQAPLWGLGRTVAAEHPDLRARLVDLDQHPDSVRALVDELTGAGDEDQLALRVGRRLAARLVHRQDRHEQVASGSARLGMASPGVLDDLALLAAPVPEPGPEEVVVQVSHAGVNYRDVLLSVGLYPGQSDESPTFGWECAGTVHAVGTAVTSLAVGDEVVALAPGALATHVRTKACLVAVRPPHLTAAEAATLPGAFLTAYHSLHDLAGLAAGERVLIHSATGGVGLAAVQIAQWKGARVFGTAGSAEKRAVLDLLGVKDVSDSRSLQYADDVRAATGGDGIDVVLNTLAGEAVHANLGLLRPYGRYVELSKRDVVENTPIGMGVLAANISFHVVDVVHTILSEPERAGAVLRAVVDLVARKVLRPLPYREFPAERAADAFRLMSRSQQVGKIVLAFPDQVTVPTPGVPARESRQLRISADGTYLVTGGLGGIGAEVARWLVGSGARHLLLTGRSATPDTGTLEELRASGVDVEYAAVDVSDEAAMRAVLDARQAAGHPTVAGVLHAAGTIDYDAVRDLDVRRLGGVLRPKVAGAWALHRLFRDRPLDFFVLFSSGSALLSSPLLGGYAAGNAFLDALAHHRRGLGLPATAIDWGFWDSVGMVAREERSSGRRLLPQGMSRFAPADGLAILRRLVAEDVTQVAVLPTDWAAWAAAYPDAAGAPLLRVLVTGEPVPPSDGSGPVGPAPVSLVARAVAPAPPPARVHAPPPAPRPEPEPADPILVAHLPDGRSSAPARVDAPSAGPSRSDGSAAPRPEAPANTGRDMPDDIEGFLVDQAAAVLGLRRDRVNVSRPLSKMGMDSLMANEYRNRIERALKVPVPIVKVLSGGTIASLGRAIREAGGEAASVRPSSTVPPADASPREAAQRDPAAASPPTPLAAPAAAAPTPPPTVPTRTAAPTPKRNATPAAAGPGLDRAVAPVPTPAADREVPSAAPAPAAVVPADDRIEEVLLDQAAAVLGLRRERINVDRPLNKMGMDSLMATEFRNRVERELKVTVPIVKVLSGSSIVSLGRAVREAIAVREGA